jgi:hypothetical protein
MDDIFENLFNLTNEENNILEPKDLTKDLFSVNDNFLFDCEFEKPQSDIKVETENIFLSPSYYEKESPEKKKKEEKLSEKNNKKRKEREELLKQLESQPKFTTPDEERMWKKQKTIIRNRLSAQTSRENKKREMEILQEENRVLREEK